MRAPSMVRNEGPQQRFDEKLLNEAIRIVEAQREEARRANVDITHLAPASKRAVYRTLAADLSFMPNVPWADGVRR